MAYLWSSQVEVNLKSPQSKTCAVMVRILYLQVLGQMIPVCQSQLSIDIQAHAMLDDIIPHLAKERGIDEIMKAHNALQWTAEMNNIKASAEEIVLQEVVYQ